MLHVSDFAASRDVIEPVRGQKQFQLLRRSGTRRSHGPVRMTWVSAPELDTARISFAISRSFGTAVERNRIRRQLREIFRDEERSGQLPHGLYLFSVNPTAKSTEFQQLRTHVRSLLAAIS